MIRRPAPEGWELVRQPDHGALACALVDAIDDDPRGPREGFRLAVAHHDDGWRERDAAPRQGDDDGPETFLQLSLAEHLEVSSASVRIAAGLDPYAEALVALHGAWLHGARVVPDPELAAERDAVVGEWRALAERRAGELGVAAADLHHDQRLCAMVDFLSLWLCGWPEGDELALERPAGDDADVARADDVVRLPPDLLSAERQLEVPTLVVGATAPFPTVAERTRRIALIPALN